ncbi:MAG: DUF3078 domain-containing protein [Candidatus Krumholzibacteriia bacterium]|nr:DUF3078 domain-containing protein [bacterium]MCB9516599.1 DUF3078 domain-containing protein [Candidatus Latescibacterota bacterium]
MNSRNLWRVGAIVAVLSLAAASVALAEEEQRVLELGKYYPSAETGLNVTQSSYSNNWNGGDKGSIVWTWNFNGSLENQLNPKTNWLSTLKLAFGQTHQQVIDAQGDHQWDKPDKSTDLIDLETIFRFTLGGYVDPFVSGRLESQFLDASDPNGRTLALNPLKFKESAGIARQFINEEERSLLSRLGFTLRQSRRSFFEDNDPAGGFGDATSSESTNDGGLEFITDYKNRILDDNVAWTSKLGFYQPLFFSAKTDLEGLDLAGLGLDQDLANFSTTLDIDWENIFTAEITKHISVNLYTRWVYDKYDNSVAPKFDGAGDLENPGALAAAVRKAGQFKQTLSLGFNYRLY